MQKAGPVMDRLFIFLNSVWPVGALGENACRSGRIQPSNDDNGGGANRFGNKMPPAGAKENIPLLAKAVFTGLGIKMAQGIGVHLMVLHGKNKHGCCSSFFLL